MDIKLLLIGSACLIFGVIMMFKHKFYKYKTSDILFSTKLRVFLAATLIAMFGLIIVFNELNKLT